MKSELTNAHVAQLLREIAQLLEIQGENRFKIQAYRNGADAIAELNEDIVALWRAADEAPKVPGIGKGISGIITELIESGEVKMLSELRGQTDPELLQLREFPRLHPDRVKDALRRLKLTSLDELKTKLSNNEDVQKKLGKRLYEHLRRGLQSSGVRLLYYEAASQATALEKYLSRQKVIKKFELAGELRRKRDTIGEIVFVIESADFAAVVKALSGYAGIKQINRSADNEAQFTLYNDLQLSLVQASTADWGTAMIKETGSDEHLAELEVATANQASAKRQRAKKFRNEADYYQAIGCSWIEPELREGRGEVAAAAKNKLPKLITPADLRGDLHAHTTWSDGAQTLEKMAEAAIARGYQYLAITDHSQRLKIARGLSPEELKKQLREIERLNRKFKNFRLLAGSEVDILEDGSLDFDDGLLRELDIRVCSIHSRFALDREKQTERVLRAMDNRYFNILGHATGRLLLSREGYGLDMKRIIQAARERGCFFEINSSPDRLDLSDENAKLARDAGVLIAISTDAHSIRELNFIDYGINQGRRAWLRKQDVLNTRSSEELRKLFNR